MMISAPIPNLIKQPAQCCTHCGKSFKKKTNLQKHVALCELIVESNKRRSPTDIITVPSQEKIYIMLLEIGHRFTVMENKIQEMQTYISKSRKKLNVVDWLNKRPRPTICFSQLSKSILVREEHIRYLMDHSLIETFTLLLEEYIYNLPNLPLFACSQKTGKLYIFDKNTDACNTTATDAIDACIWFEMNETIMSTFIHTIHNSLIRANVHFKKTHKSHIKQDEAFSVQCDEITLKIANINHGSFLPKIKHTLYSQLKQIIPDDNDII